MKCQRVKYAKEPVLHVHRYIVAIIRPGRTRCHTGFRYAGNLKDVREIRDAAPKGAVVEVYSANHNFREAWHK